MNDQPTMEITSPGGRGVAADVSGPGDGPAVVLFHSAPGSRRFDPDPAATAAAGVRLVTIDRAGYGRSEPFAGGMPSIPAYANDAAAVLDQLGIGEAVLAGWSAGGRIAAALAARRPALARALLVIATPAPDEEVPWLPDEQRPAIQTMREDPVAAVTQMVGLLEGTDPASVLATLRAARADADALEDPSFRERVEAMLSEAFIQGTVGLASDIVSFTVAPWGFDLVAIQASTARPTSRSRPRTAPGGPARSPTRSWSRSRVPATWSSARRGRWCSPPPPARQRSRAGQAELRVGLLAALHRLDARGAEEEPLNAVLLRPLLAVEVALPDQLPLADLADHGGGEPLAAGELAKG
jgi:pimeloyl-ACP methyl ester carboxylesterase